LLDNWKIWTYLKGKEVFMRKEYMPHYIRIKSDIINKISSGELRKGDRLPAERELAERFGVSRITVVGALKALVEEGVVEKVRGSGSYIKQDTMESDYDDIFSHITSGRVDTEISFGLLKPSPSYEMLMKTFTGLFQLENPNIKVSIQNIDHASGEDDAYMLLVGAGKAPTVGEFFLHADYAAMNALVALEEMPDYQLLVDSLQPNSVYETVDAKGEKHINAIASKMNSKVVLINQDLLHDAGIENTDVVLDWQILREWIEKVGDYTSKKKSDCYGFFADIPFAWHGVIGLFPYLWSAENLPENSIAGIECMLKDPQYIRGVDFLAKLFASGNPAPVDGLDLFASGRVGIALSGNSWPVSLSEQMVADFKMKAYLIPTFDGCSGISVIGNYSLGIFSSAVKNDKEIEAAWKWIKFLFRKKQQYLLSSDLAFSALKNTPSFLETKYPELHAVFKESLKHGHSQFDFCGIRKIMTILGTDIKNALQQKVSAESCIANSLQRIHELCQLDA
jgi:ABC-type glycerol-3-phosphate transport system substrate-binding protein